jgi:hypothetical protein
MFGKARPPLPIKGLAAPLLRPLPTIFTYVNLTANSGTGGNSAGRRLFTVHLRAFKAILIALTRSAQISDERIRPLLNRCQDLQNVSFWDLSDLLNGFMKELQGLHEGLSPLLKAAAKEQNERLGQLFRAETGPSRLVAVYNDQTWPMAEKLNAKLVDGCWYDSESRHENDGLGWLKSVDLVLLVSGELPIRLDIEKAVKQEKVAALVLKDTGPANIQQNMAALRTEHLYHQAGHRVLRGPFAPVRLYQAIDGCLVRQLLGQPAVLPSLEAVTS